MNSMRPIFQLALAIVLLTSVSMATASDDGSREAVTIKSAASLNVSVDKREAQIADPIEAILRVTAPRGARIELPRLPERLGDFEVLQSESLQDVPSPDNANERFWQLKITLETLKTGDLEIPSLDVHVAQDANGMKFETLKSDPVAIHVTSVLENRADPTKFRDIKNPVDMTVPEEPSRDWLAWTAGGVVSVAVIATAAMLLIGRRRNSTPSQWALAQIDDLHQLPMTQDAGDAELVYDELVDVVRQFFEFEYGVPTLTRTSQEFLAEASATVGVGEAARRRLAALLSVADSVKFACGGVRVPQIQQAFADARAFVLECRHGQEAFAEEKA